MQNLFKYFAIYMACLCCVASFIVFPFVESNAYLRPVRLEPTYEGEVPADVNLPNGDLAVPAITPYIVYYNEDIMNQIVNLDLSAETLRMGSPVPTSPDGAPAAFIHLVMYNANGDVFHNEYFAYPNQSVSDELLEQDLADIQLAVTNMIQAGGSASLEFISASPEAGVYFYVEASLYESAWDMFVKFIYGENAELTPEQNLTLTLLATIAVLAVVLLPFAVVYFVLRFIFGWR